MNLQRIVKIAEKNMHFIAPAVVLCLIASTYTYLFWDKHYAKYVFDKACEKDGGIHVYEKTKLDNKYWVYISHENFKDIDLVNSYGEIIRIKDDLYLLYDEFSKDYEMPFMDFEEISKYGPVNKHTFSITRLSDDKLLCKAISYRAVKGRFLKSLNPNLSPSWSCYKNYIYKENKINPSSMLIIKTFNFN